MLSATHKDQAALYTGLHKAEMTHLLIHNVPHRHTCQILPSEPVLAHSLSVNSPISLRGVEVDTENEGLLRPQRSTAAGDGRLIERVSGTCPLMEGKEWTWAGAALLVRMWHCSFLRHVLFPMLKKEDKHTQKVVFSSWAIILNSNLQQT